MAALADGRLVAEGDAGALLHLCGRFHRVDREALRSLADRPPGMLHLPVMAWMALAFAPWKTLWIALALNHPRAGTLIGFALASALVAYRRRVGALTFFEAATAVALAGAMVLPLECIPTRAVLGASFATLAAIWALGAAVRPLGLSGEWPAGNTSTRSPGRRSSATPTCSSRRSGRAGS